MAKSVTIRPASTLFLAINRLTEASCLVAPVLIMKANYWKICQLRTNLRTSPIMLRRLLMESWRSKISRTSQIKRQRCLRISSTQLCLTKIRRSLSRLTDMALRNCRATLWLAMEVRVKTNRWLAPLSLTTIVTIRLSSRTLHQAVSQSRSSSLAVLADTITALTVDGLLTKTTQT